MTDSTDSNKHDGKILTEELSYVADAKAGL